jgi:putative spermidine/putrescine transport system ATP-binding protein
MGPLLGHAFDEWLMNDLVRDSSVAPGAAPIAIERLFKTLGSHRVLDGVDIDLEAGTFFTLVGPSGSGKTTLLNLIAGFERPDSGDIRINSRSILDLPPHRRRVGVVFQNYALFPHLSVAENIAYPLRRRGASAGDISRAVDRSLDLVRLGAFASRWVQQLSGGQQQRIAIARALASQPSVLLMDEPMAALDKALREDLQVELKTLQRKLGATVLYITHDQREAMALADRMAVLNAGRLEQIDAPERLFSRPRTSFVARFVGGAAIFEGAPIVENDRWWLVTSGGHRLPGTWRTPPAVAPRVAELAVAPGDVRLHRAAEAPSNAAWAIEATVVSTVFGGESSSIHVSLPSGARLTAREQGRLRFQEAERVLVSWDQDAATLFPQASQ